MTNNMFGFFFFYILFILPYPNTVVIMFAWLLAVSFDLYKKKKKKLISALMEEATGSFSLVKSKHLNLLKSYVYFLYILINWTRVGIQTTGFLKKLVLKLNLLLYVTGDQVRKEGT